MNVVFGIAGLAETRSIAERKRGQPDVEGIKTQPCT